MKQSVIVGGMPASMSTPVSPSRRTSTTSTNNNNHNNSNSSFRRQNSNSKLKNNNNKMLLLPFSQQLALLISMAGITSLLFSYYSMTTYIWWHPGTSGGSSIGSTNTDHLLLQTVADDHQDAEPPDGPQFIRTLETQDSAFRLRNFSDHTTSSCSASEPDDIRVSLVTQCSIDRLWILRETCQRWNHDPIIVVLSLEYNFHDNGGISGEDDTSTSSHITTISNSIISQCPHLHLIIYNLDRHQSMPGNYPVNLLRNIALNAVTTSHVLVVDIDFVPSLNLDSAIQSVLLRRHKLRRAREIEKQEQQMNNNADNSGDDEESPAEEEKHKIYDADMEAYVIPAFEKLEESSTNSEGGEEGESKFHFHTSNWNTTLDLPYTIEDLSYCFRNLKTCAIFHEARFAAGHSTTKSRSWLLKGEIRLRKNKTNNINMNLIGCFDSIYYEPYIVIRW